MNRRNFLKAGIAGSAVPMLAGFDGQALASAFSSWSPGALSLVVSDSRFMESRRFGAEATRNGLAHRAIDGDITDLWFNQLDGQWRKGAGIVAGMTARQPLFCLEQLARDQGLRVVLRVEHQPRPDGSVAHRIEAPSAYLPHLSALVSDRDDWSERIARLSGACSWGLGGGRCTVHQTTSPATAGSLLRVPLVSWVIAPAIG